MNYNKLFSALEAKGRDILDSLGVSHDHIKGDDYAHDHIWDLINSVIEANRQEAIDRASRETLDEVIDSIKSGKLSHEEIVRQVLLASRLSQAVMK